MDTVNERPRVLIEDWLPVKELGIESRRERAVVTTLPPLNWLHVWWARRPIVASAAVVAAGLLPAWSDDVGAFVSAYLDQAPTQTRSSILRPRPKLVPPVYHSQPSYEWYQSWLLHLSGILGDPVGARARIDAANTTGSKLGPNPYGYRQAYNNGPDRAHIDLFHALLRRTWPHEEGELPTVLDSTAGGGTIPFCAARLGLPTVANDLNGVAAAVLHAGVKGPAELGQSLVPQLNKWGGLLVDRICERLEPYFHLEDDEQIIAYIHAHAIRCPRTGKLVPLVNDWWLRRGEDPVAAKLIPQQGEVPAFEIVSGKAAAGIGPSGTVAGGNARSPYDDLAITGSYIKKEAQEGRLFEVPYAIAVRTASGTRTFRSFGEADSAALDLAGQVLAERRADLERDGYLPSETIPQPANYNRGHRLYGIQTWADMFTARQLLTHATFAQEFDRLIPEVKDALPGAQAEAALTVLALMQGKALNWNARSSSWDVSRQKMRSVFDKHNFSFKWSFAEFEGGALYRWSCERVIAAYEELAKEFDQTGASANEGEPLVREVTITQGNAAALDHVAVGSIAHLCVDPPYYDNVMYAELSDFFYVWEKRTVGRLLPDYFSEELTDKENEAVANAARFASLGPRKKQLADADYEAKMTAIFTEAHRVLRDDGVLSVMFTHKRAEAWDTLGMALLQAGFTVETSWPVNTESEHSLHQAKVNAAASTIMLVCRKRPAASGPGQVFFEDIEADVRRVARAAVERFEQAGLTGVDLLLSTYGPALSVISSRWPVYSSHATDDGAARLLRPEEALDAARTEVVRLQRSRLVGQTSNLDALSDFVLIAWDTFQAHEFPFDDARRLALAVGGLDMDELKRAKILDLKAGKARLMEPKERVRRDDGDLPGVRPGATSFGSLVDAVHTVMYVADVDGLPAAKVFMERLGLTRDTGFLACVQGLVNSIPRVRLKGEWTAPEAGTLDRLVGAYLSDSITLRPVVDLSASVPEQLF